MIQVKCIPELKKKAGGGGENRKNNSEEKRVQYLNLELHSRETQLEEGRGWERRRHKRGAYGQNQRGSIFR